METLKELLKDYAIYTDPGATFVVSGYEESADLIVCTNLTYEYLVEGYYVVVNDRELSKFLKQ